MSDNIATIALVNEEIAGLETQRSELSLAALKEACTEIFLKYPDVQNLAFGISGREYNDEGLYEGINFVVENIEFEETKYGKHPNYYGFKTDSKAAVELQGILKQIGHEGLVDALGTYDIVVIDHNGIQTYEAGY